MTNENKTSKFNWAIPLHISLWLVVAAPIATDVIVLGYADVSDVSQLMWKFSIFLLILIANKWKSDQAMTLTVIKLFINDFTVKLNDKST